MHAKFQVNRQLISEIKEGGVDTTSPPEREGVEKYHLRERVKLVRLKYIGTVT